MKKRSIGHRAWSMEIKREKREKQKTQGGNCGLWIWEYIKSRTKKVCGMGQQNDAGSWRDGDAERKEVIKYSVGPPVQE
jgi:hypothetical protein